MKQLLELEVRVVEDTRYDLSVRRQGNEALGEMYGLEKVEVEEEAIRFRVEEEVWWWWLGNAGITGVEVRGALRDTDVAVTLREPRRELRRKLRMLEPLRGWEPEGPRAVLEAEWRQLGNMMISVGASIRQRRSPWHPQKVAGLLSEMNRAFAKAWQLNIVDDEVAALENARLSLLKIFRIQSARLIDSLTP